MSYLVKLKALQQNRGWDETARLAYRYSPAVSSSCKKFNVIGLLISFPNSLRIEQLNLYFQFLQKTTKIHQHGTLKRH